MEEQEEEMKTGTLVEISSKEPGFIGAWFPATIVRSMPNKKKLSVQYHSFVDDNDPSKPLREVIDFSNVRPRPPPQIDIDTHLFKLNDRVDAYWNDAWWEGKISKPLINSCLVFFADTMEEMEFERSKLRVHRDWIQGKWVPSQEQKSSVMDFSLGTLVEVSSDEEGFKGSWYTATVVKAIGYSKFLVEYQSLRTDDETKLLTETVDSRHIRPLPPEIPEDENFCFLEEVDAFYNDGWWVGVISKVLRGSRYMVYFRQSHEEILFRHSELRLHYDLINGRWIRTSQV